jgi:hypothetical protein
MMDEFLPMNDPDRVNPPRELTQSEKERLEWAWQQSPAKIWEETSE